MTAMATNARFSTRPKSCGLAMEARMAGRLECPDTDTAKMPKAGTMPHCKSSWPGAGCSSGQRVCLSQHLPLPGPAADHYRTAHADCMSSGRAAPEVGGLCDEDRWAAAAHTENMTTNVLTKPSHERWLSCRSEGINSSGATAAVATAADNCRGAMPHAPAM